MKTQLKILNTAKTHNEKYSSPTNEMIQAREQSNPMSPIHDETTPAAMLKVGGAFAPRLQRHPLVTNCITNHHRNPVITERDPDYRPVPQNYLFVLYMNPHRFKIFSATHPHPHSNHNHNKTKNQNCISKFPTFSSMDEKYSIIIGVCFSFKLLPVFKFSIDNRQRHENLTFLYTFCKHLKITKKIHLRQLR